MDPKSVDPNTVGERVKGKEGQYDVAENENAAFGGDYAGDPARQAGDNLSPQPAKSPEIHVGSNVATLGTSNSVSPITTTSEKISPLNTRAIGGK